MQDFVYNNNVKIIYSENQLPLVIKEMKKLGDRLLIVSTNSFISGGHLEILENELKKEEFESTILKSGKEPLLSKVKEGIQLYLENNIEVVLGIGGGVSMDFAKSIAFGTLNNKTPLEQYLTYQCSTEGLSHLPLITILTNPMSRSETNEDETLLQEALQALKALYQEFGIAFTYNEIASDPQDHQHLVDLIDSFGPMPYHITSVTTEMLANMIEDAIVGNLN